MKPDKKVAIIIDDFGNGQGGTEEMLSLPIKLTVAIMPFLPTSKTDAELAHKQGHDVIVHMPMEPKQGNPKWLGPGAITSNMSNEEIRQRVEEAIDNVPYAVGMNNHMGSKITGDERIMSIVLEVCRERGLFFVDSKTNYHSVVGKLAVQMGMPPVANNIFLDDRHTVSHVSKQMKAVETWASEHQNCVTIGHVGVQGKKTAEAIRQSITGMQNSVSFVGISDLVRDIWDWKPAPILPSNNN
ncbi:divergent polysaccharide deacetylase family protein [Paenibacillus sp. S28]|nr:divergent polysaccharide deacetylase family protein [Paenibacillus sp. S28]